MRTPEETARLANGVTVETPYHYPVTLTAVHHGGVMGITCSGWDPDQVNTDELIATLAADLAEARAALEVETGWRCQASDAFHAEARRHAEAVADLAEARAEVAALRESEASWRADNQRLRRRDEWIETLLGECVEAIPDGWTVLHEEIQEVLASETVTENQAENLTSRGKFDQTDLAALREVAGLVREWQAAMAERSRAFEAATDTMDPGAMAEHEAAEIAFEAIEARLLAATLPEVGRG